MNIAQTLFRVNPDKFIETAKGKTYDEFVEFLKAQPNFQIIFTMNREERHELYNLAIGGK